MGKNKSQRLPFPKTPGTRRAQRNPHLYSFVKNAGTTRGVDALAVTKRGGKVDEAEADDDMDSAWPGTASAAPANGVVGNAVPGAEAAKAADRREEEGIVGSRSKGSGRRKVIGGYPRPSSQVAAAMCNVHGRSRSQLDEMPNVLWKMTKNAESDTEHMFKMQNFRRNSRQMGS